MPYASQSYPYHFVPLAAAALALLVLAVALGSVGGGPALRIVWRAARRTSLSPSLPALAGAFAALLLGASFLVLGPPVPRVTDELSYLLGADTLRHGRLAEPPSPIAGAFTCDNVLEEPRRASRYPPAQAMALALGWLLFGSPAAALLLLGAALAATSAWTLRAWAPPPWPLLGSLWIALYPGLGSYWNQSYWGGTVAAIGSLLAVGALGRLRRRPRISAGAALGFGLGLLAASRPWEGLAAGVALAGWLLFDGFVSTGERRRELLRSVMAPAALGLLPWLLVLAAHDHATTGSFLTMPHQLYLETRGGLPELRFATPSDAQIERSGLRRPVDMRLFVPTAAAGRLARLLYHELGLPLVAVALVGLLPAARRRAARGRRSRLSRAAVGIPAAGVLAVTLAHGLTRSYFPHYSAPAFAFVWVLAITGARRLGARERGRASAGLAVALLGGQLLLALVELPAHRPDRLDWSRERLRIEAELKRSGGKHLVFVEPPGDWTHNGADLPEAAVVWANGRGAELDAETLAALPGRRAWRVENPFALEACRAEPYLTPP